MAQTRVTEFFSTRKRNRFQDEATFAKSKAISQQAQVDEVTDASPTKRCLRSSTRQQQQSKEITKQVIEVNEKDTNKQGRGKKNNEKKEKIDQLKARIQRFDAQHAKIMNEEKKETSEPPPVVKPVEKKKLNKEELKRRIEEFNRNLAQIQVEQPQEVVEKEEKSTTTSQQTIELPAYEKLKSLTTSDDVESTSLALPKSYSVLFDFFKGSDAIIKFLFDRDEVCTFLKLKMGIQNITKRTFTQKYLGQIKTVYPQSYLFKYEKLFIDFKNDYHFIISPNLQEIETNPKTGLKQFTPKVLLDRIGKFKSNLMSIVKKLHQEFLESIGIKDFNSDNLRRWHPKFDLENVKEIEEAELPKPPVDDSIKCKTGKELLNIARDIYSSRIQDAIKKSVVDQPPSSKEQEVSNKKEEEKTKTVATNAISITVEVTVEEKKDSTQFSTLLEKIRNKEKQKAFETMVIKNDEKDKTIVKYRSFTEATRFIVNFFQSEKKSTLEMDKVVRKMSESMKTNTMNELECRNLINEMAHEESIFSKANKKWLNFIKVRGQTYLQIDKSMQLNDLIGICEGAMANLN